MPETCEFHKILMPRKRHPCQSICSEQEGHEAPGQPRLTAPLAPTQMAQTNWKLWQTAERYLKSNRRAAQSRICVNWSKSLPRDPIIITITGFAFFKWGKLKRPKTFLKKRLRWTNPNHRFSSPLAEAALADGDIGLAIKSLETGITRTLSKQHSTRERPCSCKQQGNGARRSALIPKCSL